MLYVKDKVIKLGGVYIAGQVTAIEIQESANINQEKDDKGRVKKTQPLGYDEGQINIDVILEATKTSTVQDQIKNIQQLFKRPGQTSARLLKIVSSECAARGITEVYFKGLTSRKMISQSKAEVSIELYSPKIAGVKVKKKSSKSKGTAKTASKTKSKTKKNSTKTPAKDTKSTAAGKAAASNLTK